MIWNDLFPSCFELGFVVLKCCNRTFAFNKWNIQTDSFLRVTAERADRACGAALTLTVRRFSQHLNTRRPLCDVRPEGRCCCCSGCCGRDTKLKMRESPPCVQDAAGTVNTIKDIGVKKKSSSLLALYSLSLITELRQPAYHWWSPSHVTNAPMKMPRPNIRRRHDEDHDEEK